MAKKKATKKAAGAKLPEELTPAEVFHAFETSWRTRRENEKKAALELIGSIAPDLFVDGVHSVNVEYEGYGDSGGIERISFYDVAGNEISRIKKAAAVEEIIRKAVLELLPSGFENNDGGYGEVTIELDRSEIKIEHNQRFTDSTYSEETFNF